MWNTFFQKYLFAGKKLFLLPIYKKQKCVTTCVQSLEGVSG
jgi:hypothetical protein